MSEPLLHRAETRIPLRIFVKLSDPATGEFEVAPTVDVSNHGACIVTRSDWKSDRDLLVQPIRGSLSSRARVARCEDRPDGSHLIGLELYPATEDWTRSGKLPVKE
ncbi:MAG TPA: PilZ domain-containing protein [Candidatus Angelobacter sp.]|nr:PilZ domain-containing protein [Candidatus Angelobacter sp.]